MTAAECKAAALTLVENWYNLTIANPAITKVQVEAAVTGMTLAWLECHEIDSYQCDEIREACFARIEAFNREKNCSSTPNTVFAEAAREETTARMEILRKVPA